MTDWLTVLLTKLKEGNGLVEIEWYCQSPNCAARTVTVRFKDYDSTLSKSLQHRRPQCPVCGSPLKWHDVVTASEATARDDRNARISVNVQLYERDHGPFIPGSVLCDDRLPDAPERPVGHELHLGNT